MYYDEPSSTITTGFDQMVRAIYTQLLTLNHSLHEGVRIQTFPDWFSLETVGVQDVEEDWDAVPMLAMHIANLVLSSIFKVQKSSVSNSSGIEVVSSDHFKSDKERIELSISS